MKLLIAIPALNEEESIDSTIRRSIEAREFICANSPATEVAITVVSDGSSDRTVERARQYTDSPISSSSRKTKGTAPPSKRLGGRYVVMSFCFAVAMILSVTRVIDYVLNLVSGRLEYLKMQMFGTSLLRLHAHVSAPIELETDKNARTLI